MTHKLASFFLLLLLSLTNDLRAADSLYSRAFGNAKDPAVIFLHGGPGYNAVSFELSTAQRLADSGFYVLVFDQRGCGRSAKMKGAYTLDEALDDIHAIYKRHGISRASLIGHSWGGTLGIFFAERYPASVEKLILTGSPLSYQRGFKTVFARSLHYYESRDTAKLKLVKALSKVDSSSLLYSSLLFQHAAAIGLYSPSIISDEATTLKERMRADTVSRYMRDMTQAPVIGFHKSLKYTTLEMTDHLQRVVQRLPVRAIYGEQDGLFDQPHLDKISQVIKAPVTQIANASHNVFIDQPTAFMSALVHDLKAKR